MTDPTSIVSPRARRAAGVTLIVATVLSVAGMAHHPTPHGHEPAALMRSMLAMAAPNAWVHGLLIALMLASSWALIEYSAWRGLQRAPVRAATWLYNVGVLAMLVAALTSGFLSTRIAARFVDGDTAAQLQGQALLAAAWAVNQTAANFAVMLMAGAIALWSLDLALERRLRLLGVAGLAVALVSAASLALGAIHLDVHGMLLVTVGFALWQLAVGVLMVRSGASMRA
jgi:hypothetical protein